MAMVVATAALWSGWRGGVAWGPACAAALALGVWGFADASNFLLAGCVLLVAIGAVLPVQLFAAARRRAGLGDFLVAAGRADRLYRLRRHEAAAEWRDNWAAAAAFHAGRPSEAEARLEALASSNDPGAPVLRDALLASTRDWARAVHSEALDLEVRARCELGEVETAVEASGRAWSGRKPGPWLWRIWGLMLAPFAFAGRITDVERAVEVLRLGRDARTLWLATAHGAAGEPERASALLAPLEKKTLPAGMRAALDARLEKLPAPVELGPSAQSVLDDAARELRAALLIRLVAPWRSSAVLIVLLAVLVGFASQLSGLRASFGLEALAVGPNEVFRPATLLTYGLLHYGWAHLLTNIVALAVVSPIVARGATEMGLLTVFFGGIVCAGLAVWQWSGPGLVVGASGGAMAVLTAAVVIAVAHPESRGTRTAQAAWQAAAGLALVQFTFDALVPQVSMTAHLGGAASGVLLVLPFVVAKRSRAR